MNTKISNNKVNYLKYEFYCVNEHYKKFNQKTYHWFYISDTILIDCGFYRNENDLRLFRKNNQGKRQEYGIDAISLYEKNGEIIYNALQMKLWNTPIHSSKLGTFYAVLYGRFLKKSSESKGYLYYSSELGKNCNYDLIGMNEIIPIYIKNPFDNIDVNKNISNNNIILRYYQIEAINELQKEWYGIGLLNLPCGVGKTIIFCEYLKLNRPKNIFIICPLKLLTEQNLNIIKKYLPEYNSFLIDTDGTTDFNTIKNNLNNNSIFSITYKSAQKLLDNLFEEKEEYDITNSIMIVEEAHNLINRNNLIEIIKKFPKTLLVTATHPIQMEEILPSKKI